MPMKDYIQIYFLKAVLNFIYESFSKIMVIVYLVNLGGGTFLSAKKFYAHKNRPPLPNKKLYCMNVMFLFFQKHVLQRYKRVTFIHVLQTDVPII